MTIFFLILLTLVNSRKISFIQKIYNDVQIFHDDFCTNNDLCINDETSTNPIDNDYSCPSSSKTFYKCKNKCDPICVPKGKCMRHQHWQCYGQLYSQVKCVSDNINTLFGICECNYGFEGGELYPCSCNPNKRIIWSDKLEGDICLSSIECTEHYHCQYNEHCYIQPDHLIGICIFY